jgi:hypothetical protein
MIDQAKFLTTSMYMFDPNDPSDDEFREECALAARMLLEYIGSDSPLELEDPIALGGAVVAAAALAKMQSMICMSFGGMIGGPMCIGRMM